MKPNLYLLLFLLTLGVSLDGFAVDRRWTGATSNNWATASNWDPVGAPSISERAYIYQSPNNPVIYSGTNAKGLIAIVSGNGVTLTINSGGIYTGQIALEDNGQVTNNGTINFQAEGGGVLDGNGLTYNGNVYAGRFINNGTITFNVLYLCIYIYSTTGGELTNNSTGIINIVGCDSFAYDGGPLTFSNSGTITYSQPSFDFGIYGTSNLTFTNNACGKVSVSNNFAHYSGSINNLGLIQINGTLTRPGGTFTNSSGGVLNYGSLSGTITNNNGSVIVNENPTNSTIFTYQGTFTGTVNGIFTNSAATTSAGTFTAPNTFSPSGLPTGSQTLYAKITPSGGACNYVVPFSYTYNLPPVITQDPVNRSICTGLGTTFTIAASNATSYQWQVNTGSGFVNVTNNSTYSGATGTTLTISNVSALNGYQYRCIATGLGGTDTSTSATLTVNPLPTASISASNTEITCTVPTITLTASGGGTYRWDNNTTSATRTVNAAGTYSVTVTSANGCTAVDSQVITQNNTAPSANISAPATEITCTVPSILLTATGGGTYRWDNNTTAATRTVNAAGTYSVTVTSANGCTAVDSQVITQNNTPPTANITTASTEITCANPTINLTATGGGTYRWDNNTTSATRTVNAASTYSVTVTSANGCTAVDTQVITQNTTPPTANITTASTEITCANPTINLTATGGGTYRWDNNTTSATRSVNAASTYSVTVTSANGCTAVDTQVITSNTTAPSANISAAVTEVSCTVPTITLTASGGGTYRWDNNTTSATRTVNAAGTYSVTVTSANGCTAVDSQVITQNNTPPTANITTASTEITCANPTITLTASGGGTYRWDNNTTSATRSVNAAGTYSVTVTAANGCTAVDTQVITQNNTAPAANISAPATEITCTVPSILLTATGGGTYRWDNNTTAATRSVNAAGTYSVTVTSANGCTAVDTQVITQNNTAPSATILTPTSTTLTCTTTSLALTATGGGTYRWDNNTTTATRTVNTAGTYSVTVTAANGCTATASTSVFSNTGVVTVTTPTTTTGIVNAPFSVTFTATGGQAGYTFSLDNGTLPTGLNLGGTGILAGTPTQTGSFTFTVRAQDANGCTGVSAVYTLVLSTTATVSTDAPNNISGTQAFLGGTVSADGGATVTEVGIVYLTGAGTPTTSNTKVMMGAGVGTYSQLVTGLSPATAYSVRAYAINRAGTSYGNLQTFTTSSAPLAPVVLTPANGSVTNQNRPTYTGTAAPGDVVTVRVDNIIEGQVTTDASGNWSITSSSPLPDGPHSVYASVFRDGILSANSNTNTFTVDTTPPPAPVVTTPANGALLSNNTPTYTGTAEPASTVTVIVDGSTVGTATADASGNWSFAQSTPLAQGSHTVRARATDGAGNTSVNSNTNTFTVDTNAPTVTITSSATDPTPTSPIPLTFTFSESVTGFVVEDITVGNGGLSGFVGSGSTYTANFTPATPGLVSVSVVAGVAQDAANNLNGASNRFTLTYAPLPTIAGLSASPTAVCTGSPVTFTATIGNVTGSYAYTLTNGSSTSSGTSSNLSFSQVWQTAGSGVQTFTLTVAGNGRSVATSTVTVNALPVATLSSSGTLTCAQTSVVLTATGGSSYAFSGAGLSQSGSGNTAPVSLPGTYTVVVTNAAGCTATATTTVESATSTVNASLVASGTLTCANPTVTLTTSPAGASYAFSGPGLNLSGASNTATVSTAGTYSVVVTAAGGCSAVATVTVQGNTTPPTASIAPTSATLTCTNPTATLTASGGGSYRWEDGSTNALRTANTAGTYSVTVTAANGCTATASVTISEDKTPPTVSLSASGTVTCANPTVTLTASPAGQGTYRFTGPGLNQSGAANTATVSAGGVYGVTVTAANGCTASATTTVESATNAVNASLVASGTITCNNSTVTLTASPAGASYAFSGPGLNQTGAANTATVSAAGTYSVVITAAGGCSALATVTVSGNTTPPTAGISPSTTTLTCPNPTATLTATGGGTYRWEDNTTSATRTVSIAGTYSVTVTGVNGCTATTVVNITGDTTPPTVSLAASGTVSCANPTVTLTASPAGQGTYRFAGNGLNQTGPANTATVSAGGGYSVTVTAANGCTASATTTVESATNAVNATLVASGTITCNNPTVTLTASPAGASYAFSGPGLNQTGATNTATVSAAGTYSVIVTAAGGCSALATVTVSGNTTPPTAGISPSTTTLTCPNPTATLTATGGGTYRWEDNTTSATRTVSIAGTYSVTVTGVNGCTATTGVNISGDTTPPTVSLAASGTVTCANPTVTLTASPAGQGTYQFSGPGLTQNGASNTATVSAGGVYSVTLTSANGCTASATTTVESATNAVNASLVASGTLTCANPTVTLTASPAGASYAFSGPGLSQSGAINTATVSAAGTYSVVITAAGGCSALATVIVEASQELPNLSITANPGTSVTQGQAVTLTANGATAYRWSTGATGAAINPPTSATGSTVYSATGTAPNGCSATAQITLVVSASVTPPPAGVCGSQPGTIGGPLTLLEPIYNCATGQIQFRTSGGNGTPITYAAIGITGPTTSCSAVVDAQVAQDIRDGKPNVEPFTLLATQGNITVVYRWNALAVCAGTPPPTNTPPSVANAVGPQSATVGVGYSLNVGNVFTDAQTPAALMLSASGLPAGLALNGSTISGTPSTSGVSTVTLTATDPGGLSNSTSFQLTVSPAGSTTATPPVGGPLAATVVSYNCQTGAIVFGATGGNSSAVEYLAIGITGWTTNPNQMIEAGLRADPKPVTVQIRQTGVVGQSFVFDFGAFCAGNPQPPTNTAPSVANAVGPQSATVGVGYSLNVGNVFSDAQTPAALTLSASGLPAGLALNGSTITGTPSTSGVSTVTLTATDPGGLSNSTSFQLTVSPAGSTTATPPVGGPLAATVVSYNCQTGAIVFGSTGGNGSAVEYFAIGITGWTTNVNGVIEAGLRADPKPVTLRVRQNGVEGTPFMFDFGAFCRQPARVATETASELEVVVLGNPTPESWVEVQVANSAGEALQVRVISAQGRAVSSVSVAPTSQPLRQRVQLGTDVGTYLLQVATPTRTKTVKVVRQ